MTANHQVDEASGQYLAEQVGQAVSVGYKQTEVGVIPEDWEPVTLHSMVSALEAGVSVNSVDHPNAFPHGKHILKTSSVENGYFYPDECKSILTSDLNRAKATPIEGSIIVSRMNTPELVGELGYVEQDCPDAYLPDRLWQMKFRKDIALNTRWLAYILSFPTIAKKIKDAATGTSNSMKNISKGSLLSLTVPTPKPNEQTAIANALSDVDALTKELEKLIAKKQAIKTAAMQQLLTGRTRLPPFALREDGTQKGYKQSELGEIPENWEVITIDEALADKLLIDQMDGNHGELYPKSHEFSSFGVPYIGATDFDSGRVNYKTCKYLPIARAKKFKKGIAKDGDVLFAHNATVGPVALLQTELKFVILSTTATYYRCDPERLNNKYLAKFFEFEFFVKQYSAVMSQSTRNQVPILAQRKFSIVLPTIKEQTAIATILSDMDADIQTLQQRLSKTRQIKQGMMQELLTGKIRLIKPEPSLSASDRKEYAHE